MAVSTFGEGAIRKEMCRVGQRLYELRFVAANEGNVSARLPDGSVLCTPTLVSKGRLREQDLCRVGMDAGQLSGLRPRTSELKMHLSIYRQVPSARAVVHCHPPHVTAFSVAGKPIPAGVLPEVEIFLGQVQTVGYQTPGTEAFAEAIVPFLANSRILVLQNHGTVSWSASLERALWWTELLEAYCRIVLIARQLGTPRSLSPEHMKTLTALREELIASGEI